MLTLQRYMYLTPALLPLKRARGFLFLALSVYFLLIWHLRLNETVSIVDAP